MSKILEIRDHKNNLYTVKTFYKDVEGLESQLTSLKNELNLSIKNNINKVETSITEYVKESINTNNTSLDNQMKDLKEQVDSVSTIKENIETIVEVPLGKYRINAGAGLSGGGLLKNNPTISLNLSSNNLSKGSMKATSWEGEGPTETKWTTIPIKVPPKGYMVLKGEWRGGNYSTSPYRVIIDRLYGLKIYPSWETENILNESFDIKKNNSTNWADTSIYIEYRRGQVRIGVGKHDDHSSSKPFETTWDYIVVERGV